MFHVTLDLRGPKKPASMGALFQQTAGPRCQEGALLSTGSPDPVASGAAQPHPPICMLQLSPGCWDGPRPGS